MGSFQRFKQRFGNFSVGNLMIYLMLLNVIGFIIINVSPNFYYSFLAMNPAAIMHGQVWRLVTFIIFPPSTRLLYFILFMYMYYLLASTLERVWGRFMFNIYIGGGILGHILGAMVVYWIAGVNVEWTYSLTYLYMSLFLAYATTFPDAQFLLFFILPVKAKWLAIVDAVYFGYVFFTGGVTTKIIVALSLANFLVFFIILRKRMITQHNRKAKWQAGTSSGSNSGSYAKKAADPHSKVKQWSNSSANSPRHRCSICGITDLDNPEMEFRFCSQCSGMHEYCADHIFTHKHVQQ